MLTPRRSDEALGLAEPSMTRFNQTLDSLLSPKELAKFGLSLEEVEIMAVDRLACKDDSKTCTDLIFTTQLTERAPLFAHVIDLRD